MLLTIERNEFPGGWNVYKMLFDNNGDMQMYVLMCSSHGDYAIKMSRANKLISLLFDCLVQHYMILIL